MTKRRKALLIFGAIIVGLFLVTQLTMSYFTSQGELFFDRGKETVTLLSQVAKAVKSKDLNAIRAFYDPAYSGSSLGLGRMEQVEEKDGILKFQFASSGDVVKLDAALAEWKAYLDSFGSIEEAGLFVHRMESWRDADERLASVRFEVIGTRNGSALPGIDRAYFRIKFSVTPGGLKIREATLVSGDRMVSDSLQFTNVTDSSGVAFVNEYYPRFISESLKFKMIRYGPGGISAVDYDNDGSYDLFVPDGVKSRMFHNQRDGTFADVTDSSGLSGLDGASVGVFGDYDNDGNKDLFVSRTFEPNQLFHNNGNGTFTDVTKQSGIGVDNFTTVASWADYNNDGYLDLYVGRYLNPRTAIPTTFYARNGEPNQLYKNNRNGTFTNVTEQAGVGEMGLCLGNVWGDYDDDGYPDLYVVNDFGRNTLYHNNKNGTFTDVTVESGTLAYGAGMNASMADYDNDGKIDIYVTNIRSEHSWYAEWPTVARYMVNTWKQQVWRTDMPLYWEIFKQSGFDFVAVFQQMAYGNNLLRNKGDGTFEDITLKAKANPLGWFWGASFADFDNDGWQDVYMANGWVYNDRGTEIELDFLNNVVSRQDMYKSGILFDPAYFGRTSWHGWERNRYLRANGDGTFTEAATPAGIDLITNSRGVAVADFWNRGVLDIAVSTSTDKNALFRNQVGSKRHWLGVELVGTQSNRDGVGARITAKIGAKTQTRELIIGDGYGSQNSLRQYFGLNDAVVVDELTIKWPKSGIIQKFNNVAGDRIISITEGKDDVVETQYVRGNQ